MGTRTLYVSGEDESVWAQARSLSDGTMSLSKMVADGLRLVIDRQSAEKQSPKLARATLDETKAVAVFARELRRVGWERAGRAFARACMDVGADASRRKRKQDEAMTPEARSQRSKRARQTMKKVAEK